MKTEGVSLRVLPFLKKKAYPTMFIKIDYRQSDLEQKLQEAINCKRDFCLIIPEEYGNFISDNPIELLPFPEIFNEHHLHTFKATSWWMLYKIWKFSILKNCSTLSEAINLILESESVKEIRISKENMKLEIYVYFK